MRLRQENLPWLIVIAAMLGLALLPGAAGGGLGVVLLGLGGLALGSSLSLKVGALQPGRLREMLPAMRAGGREADVSEAARDAVERARRQSGGGLTPDLTLLDIGLICVRLGPEGMTMRVGRSFSGDDDGLRPYVSLLVPEHEAERGARLRFEIRDQRGATCFAHEQELWLREGQRDVLSDNQLPLAGNPDLPRSGGEWELRVSVDGTAVGMLTFEMTPSLRQRSEELEQRRATARGPRPEPPSLDDLMREQGRPE